MSFTEVKEEFTLTGKVLLLLHPPTRARKDDTTNDFMLLKQ